MADKKVATPSDLPAEQVTIDASHYAAGQRPSLLPGSKADQRILLERAALLGEKKDDEQAGREHESYLLFRLGESELYGIQWSYLVEVFSGRNLTIVPGTPACVAGVFNRRGKVLCALDLAALIGLTDESEQEVREMIVVQAAGMMVGIVVSELLGSQNYEPVHLESSLAVRGNGVSESYVHGIDKGRVTLLDLNALLQGLGSGIGETNI